MHGPAEQWRDREAGNLDAKDWYDEALKIIEKTMEEYWQPPKSNAKSEIDDDTAHTTHAASATKHKTRPLESEFDQGKKTEGWLKTMQKQLQSSFHISKNRPSIFGNPEIAVFKNVLKNRPKNQQKTTT